MSTNNPITLPSASTLTDEQLRVLCAEAQGWKWLVHPETLLRTKTFTLKGKWVLDPLGKLMFPSDAPDPLHDANAALRLLEPFFAWKAGRLTGGGTYVEIIDTEERCIKMTPTDMINRWPFWAEAPDFCRAVVLSFLRAEGKIL